MAAADRRASLGFRHHTGWAVAVAVGGDPSEPHLLIRRRLDLATRGQPRQIYHAVRNRPLEVAEERIAAAKSAAAESAYEQIDALIRELQDIGCATIAAGMAADERRLPPLERILSAHVLWHSAEGDMFREAIAAGAGSHGLNVIQLPPSDIQRIAATDLGLEQESLRALLARLGKKAGPPWQQDHRHATLAAMLALASTPGLVA